MVVAVGVARQVGVAREVGMACHRHSLSNLEQQCSWFWLVTQVTMMVVMAEGK